MNTRGFAPVLSVAKVRRTFSEQVAVEDVSFEVFAGQIVALLGPNGAGKTTTVKMCSTLLFPTSGTIFVDGQDAVEHPRQARRALSMVLGGELGFYGRATVYDNLLYFADIKGIKRKVSKAQIDELLKLLQLSDKRDALVQNLSRGLRQCLHLARGLLGNTKLLLLDEPTSGLDPEAAHAFREVVRSVKQRGCAILLTSHSMSEVEELADTIHIINRGKLVHSGDARSVAHASGVFAVISFSYELAQDVQMERVLTLLAPLGKVQKVLATRMKVTIYCDLVHLGQNLAALDFLRLMAWTEEQFIQADIARPYDLVVRPPQLEESYLRFIDTHKAKVI